MRIGLAHGASGNAASMAPHVAALQRRGIDAFAIGLPRGRAEAAVPAYRAAVAEAGAQLAATVIGGQSYGGRVASLLAADESPAGLVLLSYPLHRPGQADWDVRTRHWPAISCPVLLLSGEADPFARLPLLRQAVDQLPKAELVTYPRVGHGLRPVLDEAMERVVAFVSSLE
jgi:predicted alpha/beta-hydrolase family hydrolase